eukprot:5155031-Karenia_brevis.AAC.1
MQRLGWRMSSSTDAVTDANESVSFILDPPAAIAILVRRSVARWRARQIDRDLPHLHSQGEGPVGVALAGLVDEIECRLCNGAPGTLLHRH